MIYTSKTLKKGDPLKSNSSEHSTECSLGQHVAEAAVTYRDYVFAEEPGKAPCPILDGKLGAVLHVSGGFRGVVLVVHHCSWEGGHKGTHSISVPLYLRLPNT